MLHSSVLVRDCWTFSQRWPPFSIQIYQSASLRHTLCRMVIIWSDNDQLSSPSSYYPSTFCVCPSQVAPPRHVLWRAACCRREKSLHRPVSWHKASFHQTHAVKQCWMQPPQLVWIQTRSSWSLRCVSAVTRWHHLPGMVHLHARDPSCITWVVWRVHDGIKDKKVFGLKLFGG